MKPISKEEFASIIRTKGYDEMDSINQTEELYRTSAEEGYTVIRHDAEMADLIMDDKQDE